jgi:hypothetical protein
MQSSNKSTKSITITTPKVVDFYEKHPSISFEFTSLLMVELLEKMNNETVNNIMITQMFERLSSIENQVKDVSTSISRNSEEFLLKINKMLIDIQKEHIDTIKQIVNTNSSDRIAPLLKDSTEITISKINNLLNDSGTKTTNNLNSKITEAIRELQFSIHNDMSKLTSNPENIKDVLLSLQQNFIVTTTKLEMNMNKNLDDIKKLNEEQYLSIKNETVSNQSSLSDLLKKLECAPTKGQISENILSNILQSIYPYAEIDFVGKTKESGDFIMDRIDKPRILIENKNWSCNVFQEEVKKFVRDIEIRNCSGIFLSQNTGIANKHNYEINIHKGNVLVYVHNVNNDPDKIKIAIDIIDHFKERLNELTVSDVDSISKETLNEINNEYLNFTTQRTNMNKLLKDFTTNMTKQIDSIAMPCLKEYLSSNFGEHLSLEKCDYCGKTFKNFAAVKAHQRSCDKKIEREINIDNGDIIDYSKLTLSQLKTECTNKNIKHIAGKNKDELISLLKKNITNYVVSE